MLSRRPQIADIVGSGSEMRSRTGRVLAALGLVSLAPEVAAAGPSNVRRNDSQGLDTADDQDDRAAESEDKQESDRKNDSKASDKSGESGRHDRDQERSANGGKSEQDGSDGDKSRGDSPRRNAESESTSEKNTSADDSSHHHGHRHVWSFEQKAGATDGASPTNSTSDHVPNATTATPANPNVAIDDIPDTSANDLVVQGNDDVIATVSANGGFAFARSGDVVAVTGPDGASIIRTGGESTGTNGTNPSEPSPNGGNNNVDFAS